MNKIHLEFIICCDFCTVDIYYSIICNCQMKMILIYHILHFQTENHFSFFHFDNADWPHIDDCCQPNFNSFFSFHRRSIHQCREIVHCCCCVCVRVCVFLFRLMKIHIHHSLGITCKGHHDQQHMYSITKNYHISHTNALLLFLMWNLALIFRRFAFHVTHRSSTHTVRMFICKL